MSAPKIRVRCLLCEWKGVRTPLDCECYDVRAMYCRPGSPGPGCPSGVVWPCPRCGQVGPDVVGPHGGKFSSGSSVVAVAAVKKRAKADRS